VRVSRRGRSFIILLYPHVHALHVIRVGGAEYKKESARYRNDGTTKSGNEK
jgi:hypothetical protein